SITNVTAAATGIYTVTVTNANGCSATATVSVVINQLPAIPTLTPNKSSICIGETTNITASGCSGTILWSTGQTTNVISVSPTTTTTYTATCTASSTGCMSEPASVQITVIQTDPITVSACAPGTSAINPTSSAEGFNIFVQNGIVLKAGNVDAGMATGGNITLDGSTNINGNNPNGYATKPTIGGDITYFYTGGKIIYTSGSGINVNGNGYAKVGDITGSTFYPNGSNARITKGGFDTTPSVNVNTSQAAGTWQNGIGSIDFNTAFSSLQATASSMSTQVNTIAPTFDPGNTSQPKLTLQTGTNVWNVTGTQLNAYSTIVFNNYPDASKPLLINVNASGSFTLTLPNISGIGDVQGQYIIWNFYNTTNLTLSNSSTTMKGTLFAPNADLTKNSSSNIDGQVIAKSFMMDGGGSISNQRFNTTVAAGTTTDCPPVCAGSAVTLRASGCTSTVTWSGGNITATGTSTVVNPTTTTTYTATCGTGVCTSSANITVEVVPTPTVSVNDVIICNGQAATLTATGCNGTVVWNNGSTTTTITVTPTGTGTYSYTAICKLTTNGVECTASATATITVNSLPVSTANSNTPVCVGKTLNLTSSGGTSYSWVGPNSYSSTVQNPSITNV
ncbi:collagen-binding domain-containing protein, partial [Emticicia fontis]